MKWIEIYYPDQHEAGQSPILATDLECSECGFHLYPPIPVPECPRCSGENES